MICNKCGYDNFTFHNYCSNDGENLDDIPKKLTLQANSNKFCAKCGGCVNNDENYCMTCGEMLYVPKQNSNLFTSNKMGDFENITQFPQNINSKFKNINLENFKNIDKKGVMLSVIFTLVLCSLIVAVTNILLYSNSSFANEIQYLYGDIMPSKFKLFISNLASMNVPSIKVSLKVALVNAFNISVAMRCIIYPLIVGLCMFISVRIGLRRNNSVDRVFENSISCAILYSFIMIVIGFIGNFNYSEDGSSLIFSINTFSLFINSFIISFIGAYFGLSKINQSSIISIFFKKSFKNILLCIGLIAIIMFVLLITKVDDIMYMSVSDIMSYYSFNEIILIIMVSIFSVIVLSSWLFTLSNFIGISVFGITSFNIISLTQDSSYPLILLSLIPIIMLILVGRKIKSNYGDNQLKIICIYSLTYTSSMALLSYFSRLTLSLNYGDVHEYLTGFIYNIVYEFSYEYASFINDYVEMIINNLDSGLYLGSNLPVTIIISFIFSFVFIFLGYKSKKINNI